MEIRLLGPVELRTVLRRVDAGPPQRRAVLAALAVDAGHVTAVDTLVDRVWGEAVPAHVRSAVHAHVTGIRHLLQLVAVDEPRRDPARLLRRADGYVLEVDTQAVDLHRFRILNSAARSQDCCDAELSRTLRQALDLWKGRALADVPGEWAATERDSWESERLQAVTDWGKAELRSGRYVEVIDAVRPLAMEHPLAEPLGSVLVRALAAAGRTGEALDHYARIRRQLAEQLGIDPGPELRELHKEILCGGKVSGPLTSSSPRPPVVPEQLPADVRGFVGRTAYLEQLDAVAATSGEQPTAVVISALSGTAGVGKTALALHWAHRIRDRFPDGQLYADLRGFAPDDDVMSPADALARFLVALDLPVERIPADPGARADMYRSLLARKRMLVVLDNARDSEHVRPLLPGAAGCLVVVTSRDLLTGLVVGAGAEVMTVGLLTAQESWELLARRVGADRLAAEPRAVERIISCCARLPLALAIVAARAAAHPEFPLTHVADDLAAAGHLDAFSTDDVATDVRAVFTWSYRALSPGAARLFRLMAVHTGPELSVPAAASLAGVPRAEARGLLADLTGMHMAAELMPGRYSLHDLLRLYATELVQQMDSEEERDGAVGRLLHHYLHSAHSAAGSLHPTRDMIALATLPHGTSPEGFADRDQALAWFRAEHVVMLAAVRQAKSAGLDALVRQLAWTLSDFFDYQGHWQDWAVTAREALEASQRLGDERAQMVAHRGLGRALARLGRLEDARDQLQQALEICESLGDDAAQAHVRTNLAWLCERKGRHDEALAHSHRALDLYRAAGHLAGCASALNAVGWYHAHLGEHEKAIRYCREALAAHQQLGDDSGQGATWDSLGYAHHQLGRHTDASACYQHALAMFREVGDRYEEATALSRLGDTRQAAGDDEDARQAWEQALVILDELQHREADAVRAKLRRVPDP